MQKANTFYISSSFTKNHIFVSWKTNNTKYTKKQENEPIKKDVYIGILLSFGGFCISNYLNQVFDLGKEQYGDWFKWAIMLWLFFWILHLGNVYIFDRFFDKGWERNETDKLVAKHIKKVAKLEKKLINEGVISPDTEKKH